MLRYHWIIYFIFLSLSACERTKKVDLIGALQVTPPFYFDLYEMNSGRKVLTDTIHSNSFTIQIDKLTKGIYQAVFSWDRDVVKPQEIERFTRQPELGTPKYYMSTTFWLDSKESNNYKLLLDKDYKQAELEEILLDKNGGESVKMMIISDGANNKLYNEYLKLVDHYIAKNQYQKDSLQQVETHYNNRKLFNDADRLHALLAKDWLTNVKTGLLKAEINFMKNNIDSEVIPHIYQIQVNNKEDFEQYREVYNLFPPSIRQDLAAWNKSN